MSEEILDYSRQRTVNLIYAVVLITVMVVSIILQIIGVNEFMRFILNVAVPPGLFLLSSVFGLGSKRAIDYIPGEWKKEKVWVSFREYENMREQYEEAYEHLFASSGEGCCWFFLLLVTVALGVLSYVFDSLTSPLINPLIDSILLTVISYGISSVAGFISGFRKPKIDATEFFKRPVTGAVYDFSSELEDVPGIRAGLNVEVGERGGVKTMLDAECKAFVEGLPDTVAIGVQVSQSGFDYPYLVGTIYKGQRILSSKGHPRLATRYPPVLEYSMDGDVLVIVARFQIPKRTSGVPSISKSDFRQLAGLLAKKLKEAYEDSDE